MDLRPVSRLRRVALVSLALLAAACDEGRPHSAGADIPTPQGALQVPHEQYVQAGPTPAGMQRISVRNPFDGDPNAIAVGERLYSGYNCVVCHGGKGEGGGMAPSLDDGRWRYGGSAAEIYQSIYEGRPLGMPRWGGRITDEQIWMLVAYLQSLRAEANMETVTWPGVPSDQGEDTQG